MSIKHQVLCPFTSLVGVLKEKKKWSWSGQMKQVDEIKLTKTIIGKDPRIAFELARKKALEEQLKRDQEAMRKQEEARKREAEI